MLNKSSTPCYEFTGFDHEINLFFCPIQVPAATPTQVPAAVP